MLLQLWNIEMLPLPIEGFYYLTYLPLGEHINIHIEPYIS